MELSLALALAVVLGLGLTHPIDHLFPLLVVLLDVAQMVPVVGAVVAVLAVAPVARAACRHTAEELHLPGQSLQLAAELPVLLLQQGHGPAQRSAQAGRLLQAPLHPQLERADVHVDLPDGVPQGVLVAGQGSAHRLPLGGGGPGVTQVPHLSQGFHGSVAPREPSKNLQPPINRGWEMGGWGSGGQRSVLFYRHYFSFLCSLGTDVSLCRKAIKMDKA